MNYNTVLIGHLGSKDPSIFALKTETKLRKNKVAQRFCLFSILKKITFPD